MSHLDESEHDSLPVAAAAVAGRLRGSTEPEELPESEELCEWVYYAIHRNWCDHLIFYGDGSYAQAALGGSGAWHLSQSEGGALLLELCPCRESGRSPHRTAPKREVFVSPDGRTTRFIAGVAELQLHGSAALPMRGLQPRRRRGLVFSSVGGQCLPVVRDHWLDAAAEAEFDLALVYYGEEGGDVFRALERLAHEHPFVEIYPRKEFKWPNFRHWMEGHGGNAAVAGRYDYVWVVDDDVRIGTCGINGLFSQLRAHQNIQFACPSFDDRSEGVWRYFDRHDLRYRVRYTDFVECTAPVLKTSMLLDPLFDKCLRAARTGCFLDFCFHAVSGARADSVAIIDAVQCHHPMRDEAVPSELRALLPWEEHKQDAVYFEQAGLPRDWWWYRKPAVFSGEPAETPAPEPAAPPRLPEASAPFAEPRRARRPPEGGESHRPGPTSAEDTPAPFAEPRRAQHPPEGRESRFPGPTSAEEALRILAERAERGEAWAAFAEPGAALRSEPGGEPLAYPPRVRKTWQTLLSA